MINNQSVVGFYISVLLVLTGCSGKYFEGKILYKYQYLDKQGKDITERMKREQDVEQHLFVSQEKMVLLICMKMKELTITTSKKKKCLS